MMPWSSSALLATLCCLTFGLLSASGTNITTGYQQGFISEIGIQYLLTHSEHTNWAAGDATDNTTSYDSATNDAHSLVSRVKRAAGTAVPFNIPLPLPSDHATETEIFISDHTAAVGSITAGNEELQPKAGTSITAERQKIACSVEECGAFQIYKYAFTGRITDEHGDVKASLNRAVMEWTDARWHGG